MGRGGKATATTQERFGTATLGRLGKASVARRNLALASLTFTHNRIATAITLIISYNSNDNNTITYLREQH